MIELSESPVDKFQYLLLGIHDNVLWFDIAMHDAFRMTEIQCFDQLEQVESNLEVVHGGDHGSEISVFKVVKDLNQR